MKNTENRIAPAVPKEGTAKQRVNFRITMLSILTILVWIAGCTINQEKHDHDEQQTANASLPASGTSLDHKLICMVNNTYMGTDQIPVIVENKTYYGCCDNCVIAINTDETVRFAFDPLSKVRVDKATATITMNPEKQGSVLYFESEQNAKEFLKD